MSSPKTLAERLKWMAYNLLGFSEELDAVNELERRTLLRGAVHRGAREAGVPGHRAAPKTTGYAYTPRVIREETNV